MTYVLKECVELDVRERALTYIINKGWVFTPELHHYVIQMLKEKPDAERGHRTASTLVLRRGR